MKLTVLHGNWSAVEKKTHQALCLIGPIASPPGYARPMNGESAPRPAKTRRFVQHRKQRFAEAAAARGGGPGGESFTRR